MRFIVLLFSRGVVDLVNIECPNFFNLFLVNWLRGVNFGSVGIIGSAGILYSLARAVTLFLAWVCLGENTSQLRILELTVEAEK